MKNKSYSEIKELLSKWPSLVKEYQKANNKKALIQVLTTFIPFIAIIILSYIIYDYSKILAVIISIINHLFLLKIFTIQHDCGHQSFFKKKKHNNLVGFICSIFSILPYKHWTDAHNYHHANTGNLSAREMGDVPLLTVEEYRQKSVLQKFIYRVFLRSRFSILILSPLYYLFVSNRFGLEDIKNWKKYFKSLLFHNLSLIIVFAILVYSFGLAKVLYIHLSILIPFAIFSFLLFFVQHQHTDGYKNWKENWEYLLAAIKGSTFLKLPRIFQWFSGNIGFHHLHHLSSKIPNYLLEKCNTENPILEKFAVKIYMKDMFKMLSNKLWDEKLQRMITFREYREKYCSKCVSKA